MVDVFSKSVRSNIMKRVKANRNKSTELEFITLLKIFAIKGWRRNSRLFGRPDFVFPKSKVVVFIDGCFWHGHNCRNTKPKTNTRYWANKISRNKLRDKKVSKYLTNSGWKVLRLWECDLKNKKLISKKLKALHLREG